MEDIYRATEEFKKSTKGINWESSATPKIVEYWQLRLNNNLILLSNPNLINALGIDPTGLLEETKVLLEYNKLVPIPDISKTPMQERKCLLK